MKLVIVESPTKTKSLSKYLGNGFEVMATMGHIRDLPKSKTGIEIKEFLAKPDHASRDKTEKTQKFGFRPEYELSEGKEDIAKKLQTAAAKAESVILASDPDREGEAIAWHVAQVLKNSKTQKLKTLDIERVVFHSITKEAILEAIEHPREIDMNLVDAQQARRMLDRLVGYQLSPVLWKKVRRGLSAGRVQSVAVRLVVEREREIEAFKAEEYWQVRVELLAKPDLASRDKNSKTSGEARSRFARQKLETIGEFWTDLVKIDGRLARVGNGEKAKEIEAELNAASYSVEKVEKKERKLFPHPPFKTSTLQQAAANVLGWSAKKTMAVAQRLYEKGAITYHRTDSLHVVESAVASIREVIVKEFGKEYLPEKEIYYKTSGKVVAQEAHEGIRPTHIEQMANDEWRIEMAADRDEEKLYELIWRRTIACQMKPAVVDQVVVWVAASKYQLKTIGETYKFASWKKLYKLNEDVVLPEIIEGEKLTKKEVTTAQKFTLPPARFNDASLIKELEKKGIGRPSTYAPTISTIIVRGYVERKEKKFFATQIGLTVTDFLMKNFPKEMEYEFTAKMEANLDEIATGEKNWQEVLSEFYGPFEESVERVTKDAERVKMPVESTGKVCPLCGVGEVVIRTGKFGKFYSCSTFPECKYTAKIIEYVEGVVCPKDGGKIVVKRTHTGREFYGCGNYPKCDFASWKKPQMVGVVGGQVG